MKLDMHCHTKEGSVDSNIGILLYARHLAALGYDGMLVTDHNSYRGYEQWLEYGHTLKLPRPFTVLKGIEYDTSNAGHFIIILPDHVHLRLLRLRGLSACRLEQIVHQAGGILGPAHPYGNGRLAIMHTQTARKRMQILRKCDFIESYNGCETPLSNQLSHLLATRLKKPVISGSDAHRLSVIGSAYTIFDAPVHSNNDLIALIKQGAPTQVPPYHLNGMYREWSRLIQSLLNLSYRLYHRILTILVLPARLRELRRFRRISS